MKEKINKNSEESFFLSFIVTFVSINK